jgi:hypothetical protein
MHELLLTNSTTKYIDPQKMGGHHLNEFLSPFIKFLASIIESFLHSMSVQNDDNQF